jgi:hypothetical protein
MKRKSPALLALTASALAALSAPRAPAQDAGAEAPQVDYRFSAYREGALAADQVMNGDGERYEIDTHQFRVTQPLGDGGTFTGDLAFETMSGASPWWVQPGPGGKPLQVMSGASIEDKRTDVLLGMSRRKDGTTGRVGAGYSFENDYEAINGSLGIEHELADRVTTLSFSVGHSADTLEPTQAAGQTRVNSATRSATTAVVGYARVLDSVTVVQTSLGYTLHDGFLSDPYKLAWVDSTSDTVPDRRPAQRNQFAWLTRLRHFFKGPAAALHADYRYYHDDWEVHAHTLELAWHQRVGATLRVVPGLRYYSQSQAYFYAPYYNSPRADGLAASDYRLAPYGAVSGSLMANAELAGWGFSLRYERYDSDGDYALGDVALDNPGLVDFEVLSLGVKKAF